jgi:hypothetical protein
MNEEKPVTKTEVKETIDQALDHAITRMERFVLEREASLIWKVIALQVTLIAAIAGAQWAAITWMMAHWKP